MVGSRAPYECCFLPLPAEAKPWLEAGTGSSVRLQHAQAPRDPSLNGVLPLVPFAAPH